MTDVSWIPMIYQLKSQSSWHPWFVPRVDPLHLFLPMDLQEITLDIKSLILQLTLDTSSILGNQMEGVILQITVTQQKPTSTEAVIEECQMTWTTIALVLEAVQCLILQRLLLLLLT